MAKKRHPTDRNRTAKELAERLSQIKPIDPFVEDVFEIQPDLSRPELLASDMIALGFLKRVTAKGLAYKAVDLYYLLKYTTNVDSVLKTNGMGKWSYRSGPDTVGARPTFTHLWSNGYIRKFAKGRFSPSAGGRPYGVHYLIWQ